MTMPIHIDSPETLNICCIRCNSPMFYNGIWPWSSKVTSVIQGVGFYKYYCQTCQKPGEPAIGIYIPAANPPEWTGNWDHT